MTATGDATLGLLHADGEILIFDKPSGLLSVPAKPPGPADCLEVRAAGVFPARSWCTGWTVIPPG